MQNLQQLWSNLAALTDTAFNNPVATLAIGALSGGFLVFILSLILQERYRKKCGRIQEEADLRYSRLQSTTRKTTEKLALLDESYQKQTGVLNQVRQQNATLSDQVKTAVRLEQQVSRQVAKIEALTEMLENRFDCGSNTAMDQDPLSKHENVINHITTGLQRELSSMHDQIADQSRQITDLETRLAQEHEGLAEQIVSKSQALPDRARKQFEAQVVEPIFQQIDGLREKVNAIPTNARNRLDQHIVIPLNKQVEDITTKIRNTPDHLSAQINQSVTQPINQFIGEVNDQLSLIPGLTTAKINSTIVQPLSALIEDIGNKTRQMPDHLREFVQSTVLDPLEQQLAAIVAKIQSGNQRMVTQVRHQVIRPAGEKAEKLIESGKSASADAFQKARESLVQSIRRASPAVTPAG